MNLIISANGEYLYYLNTHTEKIRSVKIKGASKIGAMLYQGDTLIVADNHPDAGDVVSKLHFLNGEEVLNTITCPRSKDIQSMSLAFAGKIYVTSAFDDCLCSLTFGPNFELLEDKTYYSLNKNSTFNDDYYFKSVFNFRGKWYASIYGLGWRSNDFTNGAILEMSQQRVIYSGTKKANTIFFNSAGRICFCECGRFTFGTRNIQVAGQVSGAVECVDRKGYYIGIDNSIVFVDYSGKIKNKIKIPSVGNIHSILINTLR